MKKEEEKMDYILVSGLFNVYRRILKKEVLELKKIRLEHIIRAPSFKAAEEAAIDYWQSLMITRYGKGVRLEMMGGLATTKNIRIKKKKKPKYHHPDQLDLFA